MEVFVHSIKKNSSTKQLWRSFYKEIQTFYGIHEFYLDIRVSGYDGKSAIVVKLWARA